MNRTLHPISADAKPCLPPRRLGSAIVAAALSVMTSLGVLGATVGLFQHDRAPFDGVAVAERACSAYRWLASERDACIGTYLAASRNPVASR